MRTLFFCLLFSTSALAADPVAEQLFNEARELMQAGKVAKACSMFQESLDIEPALGTLLNLAACEERMGSFARAHWHFSQAATQAHERQDKRENFANTRLKDLATKLAFVAIDVGPLVGAATVAVGPIIFKATEARTVVPSQPGPTLLVLRTAKGESERVVELKVGDTTEVTLELPPPPEVAGRQAAKAEVARLDATAPPTPSVVEPEPAPAPKPVAQPAKVVAPMVKLSDAKPSERSAGVALTATAGVLMTAAAVGLIWSTVRLDMLQWQRTTQPPDTATYGITRPEFDTIAGVYVASWVTLGVSAAVLAAGVVLLQPGHPETPRVSFIATPAGGAVSMSGHF